MSAFELTYLGRTRFHEGRDAAALFFRVIHKGRYVSAYAGAISGPDLVTFGPKPPRSFWAALAHVATTAIGVRLLANTHHAVDVDMAQTIWIKPAEVRAHLGESLPLPVEDEVFRTFELEEDPLANHELPPHSRILSTGRSSITLKAAAARSMDAM